MRETKEKKADLNRDMMFFPEKKWIRSTERKASHGRLLGGNMGNSLKFAVWHIRKIMQAIWLQEEPLLLSA